MDYYIDIKILQDPEFNVSTIINVLFEKLHMILVKHKDIQVGISFPRVDQVKLTLGNIFRLHGAKNALEKVMENSWRRGLKDYVVISDIMPVPDEVLYSVVRRVQIKSNFDRLKRRQMRRHQWSEEEFHRKVSCNRPEQKLNLPYVKVKSSSTNQSFRLFIEHSPVRDQPINGMFTTYGLSSSATIPWF